MSRLYVGLFATSGIGLLISVGLMAAVFWPTPRHALATARERWHAQHLDRYRLLVEHRALLSRCQQEVEIADEQIVAVAENSCPYPATTTINDLFATTERYMAERPCGPNGCDCDGSMRVDVVYDQQFGYPQQLVIRAQPSERWQHLDYWRNLWANRGKLRCTVVGYSGPNIRVLALTPISAAARP